MSPLLQPLHLLLMMFAGWVNRYQLDVIDYLQEKNRVLKGRSPPSLNRCRTSPTCPKSACARAKDVECAGDSSHSRHALAMVSRTRCVTRHCLVAAGDLRPRCSRRSAPTRAACYAPRRIGVYVVYLSRRQIPLAVSAFVAFASAAGAGCHEPIQTKP
jgi:hypothetical protein